MVETANVGRNEQKSRLGRFLGRIGATGMASARAAEGFTERYGGRSLHQLMHINIRHFDTKEIIKWAFIFLIILGIGIALINVLRGFAIGIDQMACGITHILGGSNVCDPNDPNTIITSQYAFWEAEWYMRCLFYLALALIMGLLIFQWAQWLIDKLIGLDYEITKIRNWLYKFRVSGEPGEPLETEL
jgi:hypothetical protein